MKKMKKIISCSLILILIFSLAACGKTTKLTMNNYTQYLKVGKFEGTVSQKRYIYAGCAINTKNENLTFKNVVFTVRIKGTITAVNEPANFDETITVNADVSGHAFARVFYDTTKNEFVEAFDTQEYSTWTESNSDYFPLEYEVISISGSVVGA